MEDATAPVPLPEWVNGEALKRREEMIRDPSLGLTHDETWQRIDGRNG